MKYTDGKIGTACLFYGMRASKARKAARTTKQSNQQHYVTEIKRKVTAVLE
jgi:hypothetical protein